MILETAILWLALAGAGDGRGCTDDVEQIREADLARPAWASADIPEVVWRLVETAAVDTNAERRRCLLDAAEAEARLSVDSLSVAGRFTIAVILGVRADTDGGRSKLRAASALHSQLTALLEVAPDHPRARHMLGRLHAAVCRMNGAKRWFAANFLGGDVLRRASWAEAEQHLAFAESAAPEVIDHHLQLANLYRDTDRPELAREELNHALALPALTPWENAAKAEAERVFEEIERRLAVR